MGVLLAALLVLSACTNRSPAEQTGGAAVEGPEVVVASVVAAWQALAPDEVATLTTNAGVATEQLNSVLTNLDPESIGVTPHTPQIADDDRTATVDVDYVWSFDDGVRWNYQAQWALERSAAGWRVSWNPTMVHPQLGPSQTLSLRTSESTDGQIVDRNNAQLVSPVQVHSVVVLGEQITDLNLVAMALEQVLKPVDPAVTAQAIIDGVASAEDKHYTVTNLRDQDFAQVQASLAEIGGLSIPTETRRLPPTRDFARTVLAEAVPAANAMLTGTPGWRIVALDSTGAELEVLSEEAPVPGTNVQLTLDIALQSAAEQALAAVPEPAMLVAIQPSTGEILTIAQNTAANAQGPLSLMGQYPPGSIFKIVTADAVLESGLAAPETIVGCPGEFVVDSRGIHNNDNFALGDVPLTTAFAKSCNTTFANFATQLPADRIHLVAQQYGIGVDFVIPGITTLTGQAPVAENPVQAAEDGFGQGVILVTPFSAALMAATVAHGSLPVPTLIRGTQTTVDIAAASPGEKARAGLPILMRSVVTDGTAKALQAAGEVFAKTGTADNADPLPDGTTAPAHAWTVGYRGDIAFAALIVGGNSSSRTNDLLAQFLGAAG